MQKSVLLLLLFLLHFALPKTFCTSICFEKVYVEKVCHGDWIEFSLNHWVQDAENTFDSSRTKKVLLLPKFYCRLIPTIHFKFSIKVLIASWLNAYLQRSFLWIKSVFCPLEISFCDIRSAIFKLAFSAYSHRM